MISFDSHVSLAHALAERSGDIIRPLYRTPLRVDDKPDHTPVTDADRQAEDAMRTMIRQVFPDHGIIGEEFGREREDAEFVWVLDPVDGTAALIAGMPTFGTLIGLCHQGRPVLGVINQPVTGERWLGVTGRGTTFNGKPAGVRPCAALADATVFATSPEMFATPEDRAAFARLSAATRMRRFGCDCYAYGLLSIGFADIVCETNMKIYDFIPLAPVIHGAGGVLTDWENRPVNLDSGERVLASSSPALQAQAIACLAAAA